MFVRGMRFTYKNRNGIILDTTTDGVKARFDNGEEKTYLLSTVKSGFKRLLVNEISPTIKPKLKDTLEYLVELDEIINKHLYKQIIVKIDMLEQFQCRIMEFPNKRIEILEQENQYLKEKIEKFEHQTNPTPVKTPTGRPPRFSAEQIEQMKAYRMQGKTYKEIGDILGCSDVYVCKVIKK